MQVVARVAFLRVRIDDSSMSANQHRHLQNIDSGVGEYSKHFELQCLSDARKILGGAAMRSIVSSVGLVTACVCLYVGRDGAWRFCS